MWEFCSAGIVFDSYSCVNHSIRGIITSRQTFFAGLIQTKLLSTNCELLRTKAKTLEIETPKTEQTDQTGQDETG